MTTAVTPTKRFLCDRMQIIMSTLTGEILHQAHEARNAQRKALGYKDIAIRTKDSHEMAESEGAQAFCRAEAQAHWAKCEAYQVALGMLHTLVDQGEAYISITMDLAELDRLAGTVAEEIGIRQMLPPEVEQSEEFMTAARDYGVPGLIHSFANRASNMGLAAAHSHYGTDLDAATAEVVYAMNRRAPQWQASSQPSQPRQAQAQAATSGGGR